MNLALGNFCRVFNQAMGYTCWQMGHEFPIARKTNRHERVVMRSKIHWRPQSPVACTRAANNNFLGSIRLAILVACRRVLSASHGAGGGAQSSHLGRDLAPT
ncbi:unnamed protein product, partial [Meganyctiphanes norvegica]